MKFLFWAGVRKLEYVVRRMSKIILLFFLAVSSLLGEDFGSIEVVGPSAIDFGQYPAWEKRTAVYKIRNTGKGDLKILKVRKTCGCASAKCDKNLLEPNEYASVEVVILPSTIFNLYSKNIFVESSDPKNRFLRLNVSGNAKPLMNLTPDADLDAGRIKLNTKWAQTFRLEGGADIQLGKPEIKSNYPVEVNLKKLR